MCFVELFVVLSPAQSITFARAPVTGDHWRHTSNLIKSMDKNHMSIANSKQVSF